MLVQDDFFRHLHLVTSTTFFDSLTGALFTIWHWGIIYLLKWHQSVPKIIHIAVVVVKGILMHSSITTGVMLLITGLPFQLLFATSLWPRMPVAAKLGVKTIVGTCAIIQIRYILPPLCHLRQYSRWFRDLNTQVFCFAFKPGWRTRDPYSYWSR